jgi:Family of unknown function (DUF6152)
MKTTTRARSYAASILALAAALMMAPVSKAHHSSAMYDDKQTVTVEGAVTKFEWSNPHVYIYLKQLTSTGQIVEWEVEASPPSILRRLGWSQDILHAGDAIAVTGHPARDSSRKSLIPTLIKKGDATLFDRKGEVARLESAGTAPTGTVGTVGLDGVWVTLLSIKVEEALEPEKLSLTPKGKTAFKRFDEKKDHPGANCVPYSAPVFMLTPDLKRIAKGDGVILIDGEFDGAQRVVHMDVSTHDGAPFSVQGHSVGRWEGKSLVIDTTHFADNAMGNAYGLPSGARKHLVERLTPDGKGALTYHFELSDPEFLTMPAAGDVQWVFRPNLTYAPLKCDLENARRFATH